MPNSHPPIVLCLSGHDPSGGAGIQADIETLAGLGCHACTVITSLTVQDTRNVRRVMPQPAEVILEQARLILDDIPIAAVKVGLLGSYEVITAVVEFIDDMNGEPVVVDPVLAAGGGQDFADAESIELFCRELLPRTALLTPNSLEARRLTGLDDLNQAGRRLLELGCGNILLTGTHEESGPVVNRWVQPTGVKEYPWPRLPASYHGSGCTLAAAAAGLLARGLSMADAVREAQEFTHRALQAGFLAGRGQWLPHRSALAGSLLECMVPTTDQDTI